MTAAKRLAIVAWIFIAGGALSLLVALASGKIQLGTGLLAIPAGIGLLNKRPGWRTYALLVLWASVIVLPLILIANQGSLALDLNVFGEHQRLRSAWAVVAAMAPLYVLAIWQLWTLMRPDVRSLFDGDSAADA